MKTKQILAWVLALGLLPALTMGLSSAQEPGIRAPWAPPSPTRAVSAAPRARSTTVVTFDSASGTQPAPSQSYESGSHVHRRFLGRIRLGSALVVPRVPLTPGRRCSVVRAGFDTVQETRPWTFLCFCL